MNIGESKRILIDTVSDLSLYQWLLTTLADLLLDCARPVAISKSVLANQALQRFAALSHAISQAEDHVCLFGLNGNEGIIATWEKANPQPMQEWLSGCRPAFTETPPVALFNSFRDSIGKINRTLTTADCQLRLHPMPPSPTATLRIAVYNILSYTPPAYPSPTK